MTKPYILKLNKHILHGCSQEDGEILYPILEETLKNNQNIIIDFKHIRVFTTIFFHVSLGKIFGELGEQEYNSRISIKNLSLIGKHLYNNLYEHWIEFFKKDK